MKKIKIEIQYFKGCPNSKEMIENVNYAIKRNEAAFEIKKILVEDNESAEKVKFRGSPTVLINGNDLLNHPVPQKPALMCRYYQGGMPDAQKVKSIIHSYLN